MTGKRMLYLTLVIGLAATATFAWNLTARAAYETAEYKVIESDGDIQIREYTDLMLASTETVIDSQGRDGSFMRLFRYISGNNDASQRIAMTTPVFMEGEDAESNGTMGFVLPKEVAATSVPAPASSSVTIRKRNGGRFAVIRFSGRLNEQTARTAEAKLRAWMQTKNLTGSTEAEAAGYDPPFTPGPLRRNEVLIRLK